MDSKHTRRSFISGVATAGLGSTLSRYPFLRDITVPFQESEQGRGEVSKSPEDILLKRLIPKPELIQLDDTIEVKLDGNLRVDIELRLPAGDDHEIVSSLFGQYFHSEPSISVHRKSKAPPRETYRIQATTKNLTLSADDVTGIRYALNTIRQIAEADHHSQKMSYYRIPGMTVEDRPAMTFRGLHLCWFPETKAIDIERYLRWAAYYKFNHIIIEFWGTFPFTSHPVISWSENSATSEEIRKLVKLGKELGVTLIPQLNIFGHASGSRGGSGKHAILDFNPEYQSLFEPDGWVWCLSNPDTRKVLTDIVLETYEAFDRPPYYHIGADEAWGAAECRACRQADYDALVLDLLKYFHRLLGDRGCRLMMWHDMLIAKEDPRWEGYVVNGHEKAEDLLEALPKDIIVCDWQYGNPKENEAWPTMSYFKNQGFDVLACSWNKTDNIRSLGKKVVTDGLTGLLCTTWHSPFYNQMLNIMMTGAEATWSRPPYSDNDRMMGMRHLRQIGWEIPIRDYENTGINNWQVRPDTHP